MKADRLMPLMLNGKFDTIENVLTYKHLQPLDIWQEEAAIWEDVRKLYCEGIEILPDVDTVTKERIIRVFGLELTDSEEYSLYNW